LGKHSSAHSSSQGNPSSAELPPLVLLSAGRAQDCDRKVVRTKASHWSTAKDARNAAATIFMVNWHRQPIVRVFIMTTVVAGKIGDLSTPTTLLRIFRPSVPQSHVCGLCDEISGETDAVRTLKAFSFLRVEFYSTRQLALETGS
jgi:hypothetical protein